MIGGRPARAIESTCRPGDEVRGSFKVGVLCGPPTVSVVWWAENSVGLWWESVRIGVFPAGARAHLRV